MGPAGSNPRCSFSSFSPKLASETFDNLLFAETPRETTLKIKQQQSLLQDALNLPLYLCGKFSPFKISFSPRFENTLQNNSLVVAAIGNTVTLPCRVFMKQVGPFPVLVGNNRVYDRLVQPLLTGIPVTRESNVMVGRLDGPTTAHHSQCW